MEGATTATVFLREPDKLMCDQLRTKIYKIGGAYYAVHREMAEPDPEPTFVLANNLDEAKDQVKKQLKNLSADISRKAPPPPPPPVCPNGRCLRLGY